MNIGALVAEKIKPFLGKETVVHSGVTDGGELASIKHTSAELGDRFLKNNIEERHCLCHILNNAIKKFLLDYFGQVCMLSFCYWRLYLNYSKQFRRFDSFPLRYIGGAWCVNLILLLYLI